MDSGESAQRILAIDIGTTSLKAALVSKCGEAVRVRVPYAHSIYNGREALGWLVALRMAVSDLIDSAPLSAVTSLADSAPLSVPPAIKAVCISGNGPTIVSEDGTTLLWNAPAPCRHLAAFECSLFLPRIASFHALHRGHGSLFSGPEWLAYRLTGNAVTVLPEERYRGAYWDSGQLSAIGIAPDDLPPYISPLDEVGTSTYGGGNGVPVYCAGPDFIAAMIGTDSLSEGRMYDCAGSSEGINAVIGEAEHSRLAASALPRGVRLLPSVMPHLWNAAVMIEESGSIFVNYRRIAEAVLDRDVTYEELIAKCMANRDSDGYGILRYIAGNFRDGLRLLRSLTGLDGQIAVTGGQASSEAWMQMKSSISGAVLMTGECADAELLGDAALAWTSLGAYSSLETAAAAICKARKIYRP